MCVVVSILIVRTLDESLAKMYETHYYGLFVQSEAFFQMLDSSKAFLSISQDPQNSPYPVHQDLL